MASNVAPHCHRPMPLRVPVMTITGEPSGAFIQPALDARCGHFTFHKKRTNMNSLGVSAFLAGDGPILYAMRRRWKQEARCEFLGKGWGLQDS